VAAAGPRAESLTPAGFFLACQPRELGQGEPDGRLVETRARLLDEHEGPLESRFRRTSRHPTCRPQAHVSKRQLGFTLRHPGPEATGEPDGFFRHRARLLALAATEMGLG